MIHLYDCEAKEKAVDSVEFGGEGRQGRVERIELQRDEEAKGEEAVCLAIESESKTHVYSLKEKKFVREQHSLLNEEEEEELVRRGDREREHALINRFILSQKNLGNLVRSRGKFSISYEKREGCVLIYENERSLVRRIQVQPLGELQAPGVVALSIEPRGRFAVFHANEEIVLVCLEQPSACLNRNVLLPKFMSYFDKDVAVRNTLFYEKPNCYLGSQTSKQLLFLLQEKRRAAIEM